VLSGVALHAAAEEPLDGLNVWEKKMLREEHCISVRYIHEQMYPAISRIVINYREIFFLYT
jgi:hypothetical protein